MENNDKIEDIGEEDVADYSIHAKDFRDIVVWGTDWTVETIINQIKKGNIDLQPDFQRRDAWNIAEKSRFIESLFLNIPIPPIILAEHSNNKGKFIVIDGKQRLSTIMQFCATHADNGDVFKAFNLKELEVRPELNGKSYTDLESDIVYVDDMASFLNQTIRTIVLKNWAKEEALYSIFLRLNTGSKKLSPQELRQALHPGEFLQFIDKKCDSSTIVKNMLGLKKPDSRMRDAEIIVRYYAFKLYITSYDGKLKNFLDNTCKKSNNGWDSQKYEDIFLELENAITLCNGIFGNNAFSRYNPKAGTFSNRFNRALFDPLAYYFSDPSVRRQVEQNKDKFRDNFIEKSKDDPDFNNSLELSTKTLERVTYRFNIIEDIIRDSCSQAIILNHISHDNKKLSVVKK
ncbi:DUF262 domain-containing protein [Desulfovibrio litoralis]|uniref:GmrSD restriction endonucleases N-terminal domain-containing protein n=1 Tax=Desulfovibrio litoralis DSM 11393 TaxID=1121455 RepID=A0A1M7TCX6_9BACT|nr:DUF262 domain-containing protein [Desulfovibrio litoralis]SHN68572.1 Protein of unknown function DUF262 [Desulfovibrio litoralis DSM 11393]